VTATAATYTTPVVPRTATLTFRRGDRERLENGRSDADRSGGGHFGQFDDPQRITVMRSASEREDRSDGKPHGIAGAVFDNAEI
jgi:hypothetical protein